MSRDAAGAPARALKGMEDRQSARAPILNSGFRLRDTTHVESHATGEPTPPRNYWLPKMNRQDCANSGIARIYVNCIQIQLKQFSKQQVRPIVPNRT